MKCRRLIALTVLVLVNVLLSATPRLVAAQDTSSPCVTIDGDSLAGNTKYVRTGQGEIVAAIFIAECLYPFDFYESLGLDAPGGANQYFMLALGWTANEPITLTPWSEVQVANCDGFLAQPSEVFILDLNTDSVSLAPEEVPLLAGEEVAFLSVWQMAAGTDVGHTYVFIEQGRNVRQILDLNFPDEELDLTSAYSQNGFMSNAVMPDTAQRRLRPCMTY